MSTSEEAQVEPESPTTNRGSRTRTQTQIQTQQPDIPFRFHGVRKRRWGRYVSEIRLPGKNSRIWLGSFESPEMAARAHDSAAFFLKGDSAILNFPDSATSLPRPESSSRKDIKLAATKAALEPVEIAEPDCSGWWGIDDGGFGMTSFEEAKAAPLLSPLRLESLCGELYSMGMDDDSLLASCFLF